MEQINKRIGVAKNLIYKKANFWNVKGINTGMTGQLDYDTLPACEKSMQIHMVKCFKNTSKQTDRMLSQEITEVSTEARIGKG